MEDDSGHVFGTAVMVFGTAVMFSETAVGFLERRQRSCFLVDSALFFSCGFCF
jgi:hypothetical protein